MKRGTLKEILSGMTKEERLHALVIVCREIAKRKKPKTRSNDKRKAGNRKLTWEQVRRIRIRLAAGETIMSVAADCGMSVSAIGAIKTGRNWKSSKC